MMTGARVARCVAPEVDGAPNTLSMNTLVRLRPTGEKGLILAYCHEQKSALEVRCQRPAQQEGLVRLTFRIAERSPVSCTQPVSPQ